MEDHAVNCVTNEDLKKIRKAFKDGLSSVALEPVDP